MSRILECSCVFVCRFLVGGKIKKTFLATLGMAAAASVCYPREATEIGEVGMHTITDFVKQTYRDNFTC